jgi:ribose transport system ATP-binding protein
VGARRDIEEAIGRAARRGSAVLLAGMDAAELASLCDRVIVLREGGACSEVSGQITPESIIDAVYGTGNGELS